MEQNPEAKDAIEVLVRQKLTEGSEVTSNSMRPLAAAARSAAAKGGSASKAASAAAGKEATGLLRMPSPPRLPPNCAQCMDRSRTIERSAGEAQRLVDLFARRDVAACP